MKEPEMIPVSSEAKEPAEATPAATPTIPATPKIPMIKTVVPQLGSGPHAVVKVAPPSEIRNFLQAKSSGRIADGVFTGVMVLCALTIFAIVALIVYVLVSRSQLSIKAFGWHFFATQKWDPVSGDFGALPFI